VASRAPSVTPITCHDLTKHYGTVVGIEGIDLVVERGTLTGLVGPNAAGKTTLLRLLIGLLRPTRGEARFFGVPVAQPRARRAIGFMPADRIGLAGTDLDRPVGAYSSGMRQKLAIVQAVQHRPDVVLMDEPASRLDPLAHHQFEELLRDLAHRGCAVLLSSHALAEVEAVCETLAMIQGGKVLVRAPTRELLAHAPRRLSVRYRRPPSTVPEALKQVSLDGGRLEALLPAGRPDLLRAVLADDDVEDVLVQPATLEDVFLDLYRDTPP